MSFLFLIGISSLIIYYSTDMAIWSFQILGCVNHWIVVVFLILVRMIRELEIILNPHWKMIILPTCLLHGKGPSRNNYYTGKGTGECWYALDLFLIYLGGLKVWVPECHLQAIGIRIMCLFLCIWFEICCWWDMNYLTNAWALNRDRRLQ